MAPRGREPRPLRDPQPPAAVKNLQTSRKGER